MKETTPPDAEDGKAPVLPAESERSSPPPLPGTPGAPSGANNAVATIPDDYRVGYGNLCGSFVEVSIKAAKVRGSGVATAVAHIFHRSE